MPIYPPTYIRIKQAVDHLKREKKILQKDIATRMGITEVSFSRAMDRLKSKNAPLAVLAKMMGHTNTVQTQRYAKVLAQSVFEEFTRIEKQKKKQ